MLQLRNFTLFPAHLRWCWLGRSHELGLGLELEVSSLVIYRELTAAFYLNHMLHTGHSSIEERSSGLWPAVGWYNYVTICLHQSVFSIHLVKTFYRPAYLGITQPPLSKLEGVIL